MSDDDDLFGSSDGGDTDDLIAESQKSKPVAKPKKKVAKKLGGAKKRLQKKAAGDKKKKKRKRAIPDADNDSDDDDDDDASLSGGKSSQKKKKKENGDDNDDDGLFDDSDDEAATPAAAPRKPLSKKERMEALMKRKRQGQSAPSGSSGGDKDDDDDDRKKKKKKEKRDKSSGNKEGEDGYDSEDSYNSVNFERTQADNDFIDMDDDDQDAINELYAEQHFDDERPEGEDSDADEDGRKKKKSSSSSKPRGPDSLSAEDKADQDNPIMQAVMKMQKKKRTQKKTSELEEEVKEFLNKMEEAADLDEKALENRKPATHKLQMLGHVVDTLARKDIMRTLLDFDVLSVCKRWIQPLPKTGALGNVTVRQRIIDCISMMKGESGINAHDLKKSGFGKVIMSLYMHKSETPTLKRQLKSLIEQWSRPIFQKSGDMRDLEHAHATRGVNSLVGIARQQQQSGGGGATMAGAAKGQAPRRRQDIHSIIASGSNKGKGDGGPAANRVRVPYSKGFQYTVRPTDKTGTVTDKRMAIAGPNDKRAHLSKRMVEKGRAANKNQRSANISIEGRPTK